MRPHHTKSAAVPTGGEAASWSPRIHVRTALADDGPTLGRSHILRDRPCPSGLVKTPLITAGTQPAAAVAARQARPGPGAPASTPNRSAAKAATASAPSPKAGASAARTRTGPGSSDHDHPNPATNDERITASVASTASRTPCGDGTVRATAVPRKARSWPAREIPGWVAATCANPRTNRPETSTSGSSWRTGASVGQIVAASAVKPGSSGRLVRLPANASSTFPTKTWTSATRSGSTRARILRMAGVAPWVTRPGASTTTTTGKPGGVASIVRAIDPRDAYRSALMYGGRANHDASAEATMIAASTTATAAAAHQPARVCMLRLDRRRARCTAAT